MSASNPKETTMIEVGNRVTRVLGTSIEGLTGKVTRIDGANALVWLDQPEPGIGHQYVAPLEHLTADCTCPDDAHGAWDCLGCPQHGLEAAQWCEEQARFEQEAENAWLRAAESTSYADEPAWAL